LTSTFTSFACSDPNCVGGWFNLTHLAVCSIVNSAAWTTSCRPRPVRGRIGIKRIGRWEVVRICVGHWSFCSHVHLGRAGEQPSSEPHSTSATGHRAPRGSFVEHLHLALFLRKLKFGWRKAGTPSRNWSHGFCGLG
jgi:hypothetical protein